MTDKNFYSQKVSYWYLLFIPLFLLSPNPSLFYIPILMLMLFGLLGLFSHFLFGAGGIICCAAALLFLTAVLMVMAFIEGLDMGILIIL